MEDQFVRRAVVLGLILIVILGIALGGTLAYQDKGVPDFVIGTTAGALGGLTGILVRTPGGSGE